MTRHRKRYRVVWIDASNAAIVSVDKASLEDAMSAASDKLLLLQEDLQPHEQIHQPLRRVIYRLDARQPQDFPNADKAAVNQ